MHRTLPCLAAIVLSLGVLRASTPAAGAVSTDRYLRHLKFLASDELGGRGNGTPGLQRAAEYIAAQFEEAGLEPGADGSWFQPFEVVTGLEVREGNRLAIERTDGTITFQLGRTYYPLSVVGQFASVPHVGGVRLPLVFAGYGIAAPALDYDDYDGVDVRGKAILIFTDEPQADGQRLARHATVAQKAKAARDRGARLVLIVDAARNSGRGFAAWLRDPQADDYGISVLRVERSELQRALGTSIDLAAAARELDRVRKPRSRPLAGITLLSVERFAKVRRQVRNVVGVLKGTSAGLAREAVVVGAHYDHLGRGGHHSLAPDARGEIHNGADDNASGTAALLEIAHAAASAPPARTLVFAAFAGEELGLRGSAWYLEHPVVPVEQTIAMVNLDMIGRPAGRVLVSGLESSPSLQADLKAASEGRGVGLEAFRDGGGVGSSDDTSFLRRRVPAIGFFSGYHADYHRPSDDWDKIDVQGAVEVTRVASSLVERIANRSERPAFIEAEGERPQ